MNKYKRYVVMALISGALATACVFPSYAESDAEVQTEYDTENEETQSLEEEEGSEKTESSEEAQGAEEEQSSEEQGSADEVAGDAADETSEDVVDETFEATADEISGAVADETSEAAAVRQTIVGTAMECLGARYVWGGESPISGMDCSGFIRYVMSSALGVVLPHSAASQSTWGTRISVEELQPGDLVFYSFKGSRIDHVAMYIGDGRVIHTSSTKHKVVISDLYMGTAPDVCVSILGE